MDQQILIRVIELAAEQVDRKKEEVSAQSQFINDLGYDSLDVVEFVMKLEDEFELSVGDDQADTFTTVGQVAEFIESERAKASA